MSDHNKLQNLIREDKWPEAINIAHKLKNRGGFEELSAAGKPIPPEHMDNFLNAVKSVSDSHPDIAMNLSADLHPDLTHDHLHKIWEMGKTEPNVASNISEHKNYQKPEPGKLQAAEFWNSYERKVEPSHFAAIKSMYTGEPESIATHRGEHGDSDAHADTVPHLFQHMQASQNAILNDPSIKKVNVKGEPHVEVYRGIGGSYAKAVKDGLGIEDHYFEETLPGGVVPFRVGVKGKVAKHKKVNIPSAHMSSWSLDQNMAERFATSRGEHDSTANPHHVVMKKLVPVSSILHSGMHSLFPGHQPVHENEQEVVVAHPEGKYKISSKDVLVGHPGADYGTYNFKQPESTPKKINKSGLVIKAMTKAYKTPLNLKKAEDEKGMTMYDLGNGYSLHHSPEKLSTNDFKAANPVVAGQENMPEVHSWAIKHQGKNIGFVNASAHADKGMRVSGSLILPEHRGNGIGRKAYKALTEHYGKLSSDFGPSESASKVWESIPGAKKVDTGMGVEYSAESENKTPKIQWTKVEEK